MSNILYRPPDDEQMLILLRQISITGLVVLGGATRVKNPEANFQNSFDGQAMAYGVTNAMYKIIFSYKTEGT